MEAESVTRRGYRVDKEGATMKVLVTGGLGYLGAVLVPALQERGHSVTVLDNLRTLRYASLFGFHKDNPVKFIEGDILHYDLDTLTEGVDVVIHLAAITDAAGTLDISDEVFMVNFNGTIRVVDACIKNGCRLLFPSSTSVYGVNGDKEVDEECGDLYPQSPYADSKLRSCMYIKERYHDELCASILRLGTVYGSSLGWRNHTFVNKACYSAALGLPISVWETALEQKRPYLHIQDAISAMLHIIDADLWGDLYCVVSQNSTPAEVTGILRDIIPNLKVQITRSPIMNQNSYTVTSRKLQATGWTPTGNLVTGIAQTMAMLGGIHG